MPYSDNPLNDFNAYEAKQERKLKRYPRCKACGERITGAGYFLDDEWFCTSCVEDSYVDEVQPEED